MDYVSRCQKRLKEWGAPLSGWHCKLVKAMEGRGSAAEIKAAEECICKIIPHELRRNL